jgi:hypothetical protein
MDTQVQEMIEGYKNTFKAYEAAKGTPVWDEGVSLMNEFEDCAKGTDYMGFVTKVSEKNLFNKLTSVMTKLAGVISANYKVDTANYKPPSVKDAASGYHSAYDALPDTQANAGAREIYKRIFQIESGSSTAAEFMKKMAEENIFVKLSSGPIADHLRMSWEDLQKSIEKNQTGGVSLPVSEKYFREMSAKIEKSVTISGVEALAYKEASRMEADNLWDLYLISETLLFFLGPVITYRMNADENNRLRVINSFNHMAEFYNLTWDELFRIERFSHYFENVFWKSVQNDFKAKGIRDATGLAEDLKQYAVKAFKGEPFPVPSSKVRQFVVKQSVRIPLSDVYRVLKG